MKRPRENQLLAIVLPALALVLATGAAWGRMDRTTRGLVLELPGKIEEIRGRQQELSRQWTRAHAAEAKGRIRQQARELVVKSILDEIIPAWMGTPWYFGEENIEGASMPHDGSISCSQFVTAVLQNAGLRLESRPRWNDAHALYIQRSLAPGRDDLHRYRDVSPRELMEKLKGLKDGLYLIGLNCHVGFVVIENPRVRIVHSNYVDPEQGVVDEPLAKSRAIANSQEVGYWITPLFQDDRLIELWLTGRRVPLQKLGQVRTR